MVEIRDFINRLDKMKPEFIRQLAKENKIEYDATTFQKLTPVDRRVFHHHVKEYIENYFPEKWKTTLARLCQFRDPNLVNFFQPETHLMPEVYVAAFFSRPGRHSYIAADFSEFSQTHKVYKTIGSFECKPSTEDVPSCKLLFS